MDDDGDCPEHVFEVAGLTIGSDGSMLDVACARCGAVAVVKATRWIPLAPEDVRLD